MRIISLFLFFTATFWVQAQPSTPSREEFVNEAIKNVAYANENPLDYYLLAGADTCRFEKFDYDEWVKYHLQEAVPLVAMNELAYKVHMAREPYYWQQDKLQKAKCISAKTADSLLALPAGRRQGVFSLSQPFFTDDGQYAVMDINTKTGLITGAGFTFLYRHKQDGWHVVGAKQNWGTKP